MCKVQVSLRQDRTDRPIAKRFRFYTGSPGSARKVMDVSHFLYRGYLEKMTEKESSYGPTQPGFHPSSQPTHVDQEVQFFLEVNIPLNIGSRSVQMRGRHSAVKIHMNDRMHALLLASAILSTHRILPTSDPLHPHPRNPSLAI